MEAWHLTCPRCRATLRITLFDLIARLRSIGMLRRDADPDPSLVQTLGEESIHRMTCATCGEVGLVRGKAPEEEFDWPEAKTSVPCVACGTTIPSERLELFPDSQRCASCQASAERGEPVGNDREFCERCGDVLRMRARQRAVSRYEMYCPGCGASSS